MASGFDMVVQGALFRGPRVNPAIAFGTTLTTGAVGFGASAALGKVYGQYGEGDKWYNKLAKHSPEILGGVGKLIEGVLLWRLGHGLASGIAGTLGNVGLNAVGLELGLNSARKSLGIACVKVPAGTDVRKLKKGDSVPASTAIGALGSAGAGHGLAWDHIQDLASSH